MPMACTKNVHASTGTDALRMFANAANDTVDALAEIAKQDRACLGDRDVAGSSATLVWPASCSTPPADKSTFQALPYPGGRAASRAHRMGEHAVDFPPRVVVHLHARSDDTANTTPAPARLAHRIIRSLQTRTRRDTRCEQWVSEAFV